MISTPAFVEGILDVLVEFAIDAGHDLRSIGISVQLVSHVKIVERGLQHEGRRTLEDMFGPVRRLDEQIVDRLPGGVVADGDAGMENQAVPFPDLLAEIGDVAGEDDAIGDGDDFVLKGLKARDVEAAFEHHAGGIPYLDHIPNPERPHVGQADPGDQVGYGRT